MEMSKQASLTATETLSSMNLSTTNSSTTSKTNSNELNVSSESINELIQCPICFDPMLSEIFTCSNGHSICNQCKDRLNSETCPSCKENYNCCNKKINRNLTLEYLIFNTMLPCKYKHNGCPVSTIGHQRKQHLKTCKYRSIQCPFSCSILPLFQECLYSTNNINDLLKHCQSQHGFDVFENPNNKFEFQLDDLSEGSGHYRIILKSLKPEIVSLLIGFKSQNGSIVLFVRSFDNRLINNNYKIIAAFESNDHKKHSIKWESSMYATTDEIGLEFRNGLVLKLSREQVKLWKNRSSNSDYIPLTVIVGDE